MIINPFRLFGFLASLRTYALIILLSGSLVACGGSSSNNTSNNTGDDTNSDLNNNNLVDDNTPALTLPTAEALINVPTVADAERGALISVKHLKRNAQAAINTVINAQPSRLPAISALYDVEAFQLNYLTVDGQGALTEASALIALPQKSPLKRSPVLSFQHGTVFYNAEAPTSIFNETAPEVVTASLGYIV
ncbi:MAG TPA: hypothetical protein ENK78_08455, partial [Thiothrix sp.]|nr:hypothetical protein [Thiothrix sp.]